MVRPNPAPRLVSVERKKPVIRPVPAVTRAIAILRRLSRANRAVALNQLASEIGLVPSTCLHILRALVEEGVVAFNPVTKKYTLGAGLLPFAREFLRRDPFVQLAQPHLETLTARWDVTGIAIFLSDPEHYTVTNVSNATSTFSLQMSVGSRFPALVSATGRCLAAFSAWTPEDLSARFRQLKWQDAPSEQSWFEEVALTRERGYAIDAGHYIRGVTIIAAPVFDDSRVVTRCITAVGLKEQLPESRVHSIARDMLDIADTIMTVVKDAPLPEPGAAPRRRRRA